MIGLEKSEVGSKNKFVRYGGGMIVHIINFTKRGRKGGLLLKPEEI